MDELEFGDIFGQVYVNWMLKSLGFWSCWRFEFGVEDWWTIGEHLHECWVCGIFIDRLGNDLVADLYRFDVGVINALVRHSWESIGYEHWWVNIDEMDFTKNINNILVRRIDMNYASALLVQI